MKVQNIIACLLVFALQQASFAEIQTPNIRLKTGIYVTTVNAGSLVVEKPLNSMIVLQPTLLWDLNTFNSRVGIHFLSDFGSEWGLMPISGIGFSGYFYPFGISSGNQLLGDNTTIQMYKMGAFVFGGLTPVNFNLNKVAQENNGTSVGFSALLYEVNLGVGFDYPLRANTVLTLELNYRFASSNDSQADLGSISYSGPGVNFSYTASYF